MLSRIDDRRFNQLALVALVAGFALLLVAFVTIALSAGSSQRASALISHTYRVTDELNGIAVAVERTETASRGYLLSPSPIRADTRRRNAALIPAALARVQMMTADNPRQQRALGALRLKILDQLATTQDMMARAEAGQLNAARAEFVQRVKIRQIDQIRVLIGSMRDEELRLLALREGSELRLRDQFQLVLIIAGLLMVALGLATFLVVRRYTRDLTGARDRLDLLNSDLEGEVAIRTADLTRANEEIQRFAYIVSHDLRSPLVNVLGFTAELENANKAIGSLVARAEQEAPQLITDDVRFAREDLPEAIGFIRSSTEKMDRLINAILRLSREGRRNFHPEHLPMERLFADIAASLDQRLAAEQGTLAIESPLPDLVGDRVAVEQVFSNILENAIKYSDDERPLRIVVRGHRQGDRLVYEVEDNGRGIDPKDHQRIFDLFRRSGSQDRPGEGIGLAHVQALLYRLGGKIDVDSELGRGSTFTVELPVRFKDQDEAK